MSPFFKRHQPAAPARAAMMAGLGGVIAIAVVGGLSLLISNPLIMAPFGATCVLLFSVPASPLSQPANVVGGHVVAAMVGLLFAAILPATWWAVALAVGAAIAAMALLRVTHPPAGANPLVIFMLLPAWDFLIFPVLLGALILVATATAFHKATGTAYPLPVKSSA